MIFGGYVVQSSAQNMPNAKARSWCSGFGHPRIWKCLWMEVLQPPCTALHCAQLQQQAMFFPHIWNGDVLWCHMWLFHLVLCPDFFILLREVQFTLTSKQATEGCNWCPYLAFTSEKMHNSLRFLTPVLCHVFQPLPFPFFFCWIHLIRLGFYRECGALYSSVWMGLTQHEGIY